MEKRKLLIQIDCDSEKALLNHYFGNLHYESMGVSQYYKALKMFYSVFQSYGYKPTLFVVGEDVKSRQKRSLLEQGLMNGYEVANHSFSHPKIFQNRIGFSVQKDIERGHIAIQKALGVNCKGFRAPNFEISSEVLRTLQCMDYQYDCSAFPIPYTKIIRWIKNSGKLRGRKGGYLSSCRYVLSPPDAYIPDMTHPWKRKYERSDANQVMELPISVFPMIKAPCHASYLLALPRRLRLRFLQILVNSYAKSTLPLVYVFHLADLVEDQYLIGDEKKYYPSLKERIEFVNLFCRITVNRFKNMTTSEYIKRRKEEFCEK